jgi:choline dehydrogenase-like flavoprotein
VRRTDDDRVIVIGSGPCGAIAADRLTDRGVRVLLLDAGLHAPRGLVARVAGRTVWRSKGWADYAQHRLDAGSDPDVVWFSSLALGGLSNYWTAAVPRYAPEDFTDGERIDERYAWPVGYDDLEPWYSLVEDHMGLTAGEPILGVPEGRSRHHHELPPDWGNVARRARSNGDGMGATPMARSNPTMIARRGTEYSSYHCTVKPLEGSAGFDLVTGAFVTALRWSSAEGRVTAVEYVDRRSGERLEARGRAVVLAAGTIDTTAIVLRSTSDDFPDGLGNTSGLVGRYLHDHPRQWWPIRVGTPMSALPHPVYVARAPHQTSDPLMATSLTIGMTESLPDRLRTFTNGRSQDFGVQVLGTMVPTDDVGVELGHWEGARPVVHLRYADDALANMDAARARVRAVLGSAGLGVDVLGPFHPPRPGESVHFAGTVRMHADPAHGVLDGFNRMHDVPNVAVVDPSCFPTGPEKNPTLTAMALAARAADRLVDDLDSGTLG